MTRVLSITVLILAAAVLNAAAESGKDDAKGIICEGLYALCTSAQCIPDP